MERRTLAGLRRGRGALRVAMLLSGACWLGAASDARAAGTFVVDGADPGCSDTAPGAGTEGNPPYCTISAAAAARGGPGTTILVKPAIYREQVTVPASGAEGSPFVLQAVGPGVVVDGADDFSDAALWTLFSGDVWLAAGVTRSPDQLFVDGARLSLSTAAPADLLPGTFRHVLGEGLYVNVGGDNPGTHQILVGPRRDYGFALFARFWVTIDGFTVTRTARNGIKLSCGPTAILDPNTVTHNTVTLASGAGILVESCWNVLLGSNVVSDSGGNGVGLIKVRNSTIEDNTAFRSNWSGMRLDDSHDNLLQRNNVHDNLDSGIHFQGSTQNISLHNLSWRNGGHGFHHTQSAGTLHVGDVAWGNAGRGFSLSLPLNDIAIQIFNSIGINNGLTTREFNLFVESRLVSNFNIWWNSTSQNPIKYNGVEYATLAAFTAATGQDATSIQANPRFVNPEAGDFRLFPGSPAIDSADSSVPHWPETDAAGQARVDDPATVNTGAGPVPYADRGVLEHYPFSGPPGAALTVTPASGRAPLTVIADASGSGDPDGLPLSYRFEFGDGTVVGPQAEATTSHTYTTGGIFTVTVTVTDAAGETDAASAPVTVVDPTQPPVAALTVTPASGTLPLTVTADASGSSDPDGPIVSYRFDFGDGTIVGPQGEATATHTYWGLSRILTVTVTVTDDLGATGSASATVTAIQELEGFASFEDPGIPSLTAYGGATIERVPGGIHGAFALEVRGPASTAQFGINDSPNWVAKTLAAGTRYRFSAWVRSATSTGQARLRIREYLNGVQVGGTTRSAPVTLGSAWQRLAVDHVAQSTGSTLDLQVLDLPVAPGEVFQADSILIRVVTGPGPLAPRGVINTPGERSQTLLAGHLYGFSGSSWDPDNYLPLTYLWNFGGGAPNSTAEDPGAVTFSTPGTYTVTFTVTNTLGLETSDSVVITVPPGDNLVGNPSFESDTSGWRDYGGPTLQRVPGGAEGAFALEVRGPASTGTFGINDSPNWVAKTAGTIYSFSAWVRSEASTGRARIRVREYLNGVLVGTATYSPFVSLIPDWQLLTAHHNTWAAGSTLDVQVLDYPVVPGEVFQVDSIAIAIPGGSGS